MRRVAFHAILLITIIFAPGVAAYLKNGGLVNGRLVTLKWSPFPVQYFVTNRDVSGVTAVQRVIGTAVLLSAPGVFSFTDLLTSEVAFLVVLLALLLSVPRDAAAASPARLVSVGLLAGAAVLTATACCHSTP